MQSLLSSVLHSAPLLGSPSAGHPTDPTPIDTTQTTVSDSLSARTTPASSVVMEVDPIDTVPQKGGDTVSGTGGPDTYDVVSDPEEVYVEARESMGQADDAMFEGEETENHQHRMELGGHGDVNSVSAFQTPDRKRTFEVDSKTITRPKKTSPLSVPLPEVFNQENQEELPAFRPIATSTPTVAMSAATTSATSVSPRPAAAPAAAAAAAATPAAGSAAQGAGGGLQETAKRPVASSSASSTAPPASRPRQQTMVVSSMLSRELKTVMEQERASFVDEAAAARIEARLLALVQDKEKEWAGKHEKLGQIMVAQKGEADAKARQAEADLEGVMAALEAANAAMEAGFASGPSTSSGGASSLPHLPPAPVIAAMSADKLAELARLKKEVENLENENNKLHSQYNSLYDTYSQQRSVIPTLKSTNEELERAVRAERERFDKLRRHAEAKLDEASGENEALRAAMKEKEKEHDNNTLSIRMRLKQREGEVAELEQSVAQKRKQVADLKEICNELIKKADMNASDIE